jgi:hypothetical protein
VVGSLRRIPSWPACRMGTTTFLSHHFLSTQYAAAWERHGVQRDFFASDFLFLSFLTFFF